MVGLVKVSLPELDAVVVRSLIHGDGCVKLVDEDFPVSAAGAGGAKKGGLAEGGFVIYWRIGHFGVLGGPRG